MVDRYNFIIDFSFIFGVNYMQAKTHGSVKMAYVVVNRRSNVQFYSQDPRGYGFANPPPGTIVDSTVTANKPWVPFSNY